MGKKKGEEERLKVTRFGVATVAPDGELLGVELFKRPETGDAIAKASGGVKCIVVLIFHKDAVVKGTNKWVSDPTPDVCKFQTADCMIDDCTDCDKQEAPPPLPEVCRGKEGICNIGYACDGCPLNVDKKGVTPPAEKESGKKRKGK